MARFPTREADVAALAGTIAFGLVENAEDFPDCPVSVEVLQESLARYNRAKEIAASAQGAAAEAFEEKQDAVQDLTDKMKNVLRYAEIAVRQDEAKLKNLGWGGRRDPVTTDKPIVVACYSGQSAGHAVLALNLLGYSAKSLKFGMSSWHTSLSGSWNGATNNTLQNEDKSQEPSPELANQPYPSPIGTNLKSAVMNMLDGNFKGIGYTGDTGLEVNLDNENYFVVNYFGEADYMGNGTRGTPGHIRGAHQFTPGSSLGLGQLLNKLPSDENALVVVYCWTGQTSSQITAYLNMLGYNAKSLKNGSNNLFYDELNAGGWKWDGDTVIDRPLGFTGTTN